jgi:hypothetical protein
VIYLLIATVALALGHFASARANTTSTTAPGSTWASFARGF